MPQKSKLTYKRERQDGRQFGAGYLRHFVIMFLEGQVHGNISGHPSPHIYDRDTLRGLPMKIRNLVLVGLMATSLTSIALGATSAPGSNAQPEPINDVKEYLTSIDDAIGLTQKGAYGTINPNATRQLQVARDRIAELLKGHTNGSKLDAEGLVAVRKAQDEILAILGGGQQDQVVCTRESVTGSRFATTECVSERDHKARANAARDALRTMVQRGQLGGKAQ